jgi:hypothetical protein
MSRIEIIVETYKRESFRFYESVERELERVRMAVFLVDLFLLFQLLTYSLAETIQKFGSGPTIDALLQSNNYS